MIFGIIYGVNGVISEKKMKKAGENRLRSGGCEAHRSFAGKGLFFAVSLLLCIGGGVFPQTSAKVSATAAANVPATVPAKASATAGREVVLVRGNYWISGIAGFGANGFSALAGEYRFQAAGEKGNPEGDFSVYVTREALYFSGEWQVRPGTGNIPVVQRTGEEGYLVAAAVDDGHGISWTAVFRFKRGLEGSGISGDLFNRMLQVWTSRLSYFLSNSRTAGDISLPAVLEF